MVAALALEDCGQKRMIIARLLANAHQQMPQCTYRAYPNFVLTQLAAPISDQCTSERRRNAFSFKSTG
jgi:hypothetical protein